MMFEKEVSMVNFLGVIRNNENVMHLLKRSLSLCKRSFSDFCEPQIGTVYTGVLNPLALCTGMN